MGWRGLVIGAMALGLSACNYRFHMEIAGPLEAPVMTTQAALFGKEPACLTGFSVVDDASGEVVWAAVSDGEACTPASPITYGHAPAGFHTTSEARPLKAGVVYGVTSSRNGSVVARVTWTGGQWRRIQ